MKYSLIFTVFVSFSFVNFNVRQFEKMIFYKYILLPTPYKKPLEIRAPFQPKIVYTCTHLQKKLLQRIITLWTINLKS